MFDTLFEQYCSTISDIEKVISINACIFQEFLKMSRIIETKALAFAGALVVFIYRINGSWVTFP